MASSPESSQCGHALRNIVLVSLKSKNDLPGRIKCSNEKYTTDLFTEGRHFEKIICRFSWKGESKLEFLVQNWKIIQIFTRINQIYRHLKNCKFESRLPWGRVKVKLVQSFSVEKGFEAL